MIIARESCVCILSKEKNCTNEIGNAHSHCTISLGTAPLGMGLRRASCRSTVSNQYLLDHSPTTHLVIVVRWEENPSMQSKYDCFVQNLKISKLVWLLMRILGAFGLVVVLTAWQYMDTQSGAWDCETDSKASSSSVWKGDGGNRNISTLKHIPSDSKLCYLISKEVFLSKAIDFQGNLILGWAPRFTNGRTICISRRTHMMLSAPASTVSSWLWKTLQSM